MSNVVAVLRLLSPYLPEYTSIDHAIDLAEKIDRLYTGDPEVLATPDGWAKAHVNDRDKNYLEKKIHFIKDIRQATNCSLLDAKNAAEAAISDANLQTLRDKLTAGPSYTDYTPTWNDEEPPF